MCGCLDNFDYMRSWRSPTQDRRVDHSMWMTVMVKIIGSGQGEELD